MNATTKPKNGRVLSDGTPTWFQRYRKPDEVNPATGKPWSTSNLAKKLQKRRLRIEQQLADRDEDKMAELMAWVDEHAPRADGEPWTGRLISGDDQEATAARSLLWRTFGSGPAVARHHGLRGDDNPDG